MTHDPHDFNNLSTPVKTRIEIVSGELVAVQGEGSIIFFKKIKIRKLSLCSYTIIKITFYKPSYKGVELCGSHVSYCLPFIGHSYERDHWAWY